MMESTRPIRALLRGLDALTALNTEFGATVAEVAKQIKLPRTTTYRILETLLRAGYVYRNEADDRYRLDVRVRSLSEGFDDEAWVTRIARPLMRNLCDEIAWPVAMASPHGTDMVVRESTDARTPLGIGRLTPGFTEPLLTSASGRAYLAFCPPGHRESLLEILARSNNETALLAKNRPELQRILDTTRTEGYAAVSCAQARFANQIVVALPVMGEENRVLGAVSVRFCGKTMPPQEGVERFLPKLRETATRIQHGFAEQQHTSAAYLRVMA